MACRSCKRCSASCSKRRIPVPKRKVDGHVQRYWMKRKRWIRKNFPNQDWDKDGVKNKLDCEPEDPRFQDVISKNLSKDKYEFDDRKDIFENPRKSPKWKGWFEEEEDRAFRRLQPSIAGETEERKEKWAENHPDEYEDIIREADDKTLERVEGWYGNLEDRMFEAKRDARKEVDSTVASLSSEELERELAEIGENPEEFDEFAARRKLRKHWEDVVDGW